MFQILILNLSTCPRQLLHSDCFPPPPSVLLHRSLALSVGRSVLYGVLRWWQRCTRADRVPGVVKHAQGDDHDHDGDNPMDDNVAPFFPESQCAGVGRVVAI